MSLFEIIMLVCFGISWPLSIAKALRTREVAGKSPLFMIIVMGGYASGIIHKLLYSHDWVISLYMVNLLMVSIDLYLYLHFSHKKSVSR
ncbi:MAG: hypothetical protein JW863_07300 [Chitinispirillaceae bacterium]|nr:hypothetical protein [Chitinispirillaceae bacterium]